MPLQRVKEAEKLGFQTCVLPMGNLEQIKKMKKRVTKINSIFLSIIMKMVLWLQAVWITLKYLAMSTR